MTRTRSLFFVVLFFSFIVSLLISKKTFAANGDAVILTKEEMNSFEKLTFYKSDASNMIDCDLGGISPSSVEGYEFLTKQVLMPTGNGRVRVVYGKIGEYRGRKISAIVVYSDFVLKDASYNQRDGRYLAIPYNFTNSCFYDGDSLTEDIVFYYSDDPNKTPIDMTNAYLVINELNIDEYAGARNGQKIYISEDSQLQRKDVNGIICYGNGKLSKEDYSIIDADNYRYCKDGEYYYDDPDNKYYHIDSVLFRLNGTHNSFYIEDKRKGGGYGIKWAMELNSLQVRYNINTSVEHGTITPSMTGIKCDSEKTVTFHPEENYVLEKVTVDGKDLDINDTLSEYTFSHIFEDHNINVIYKPDYKTIKTEVVNGTISEDDDKILRGSDKQIEYKPNEGYLLDSIVIDGNPIDPTGYLSDYLFKNVQTDHTIRVVYSKPELPVKSVTDNAGNDINTRYVKGGDILVYNISYKNPLKRKLDIIITDTVPEYTELYAAEGGSVSGNTVTWKKQVDPGKDGSVTMKVRVIPGIKDKTFFNYAIQNTDNVKNMSNTVNNTIPIDPVKTVTDPDGNNIDGTFLVIGQEVIYGIAVKNNSTVDLDYTIKDKLPGGMEFICADNAGKYNGGEIIWNIRIAAGEEKKVSCRAKTIAEGVVCINQASVVSEGIESVTNKVENWVLEKPKKEVKQNGASIDGKNLSDGEIADYSITVKNPSSRPTDIRISDKLPEYLEIKSISDGGRSENGVLEWDLHDVGPKETVTVSFTAAVKGGEEDRDIVNSATISIGDRNLISNETTLHVPEIKKLKVLGEKKSPEPVSINRETGVLGERKISTGDGSSVLVFVLLAMCAFAGLEIIKVRRRNED
jgi:uncharacterized repeat protein (TIGR01451 family)